VKFALWGGLHGAKCWLFESGAPRPRHGRLAGWPPQAAPRSGVAGPVRNPVHLLHLSIFLCLVLGLPFVADNSVGTTGAQKSGWVRALADWSRPPRSLPSRRSGLAPLIAFRGGGAGWIQFPPAPTCSAGLDRILTIGCPTWAVGGAGGHRGLLPGESALSGGRETTAVRPSISFPSFFF